MCRPRLRVHPLADDVADLDAQPCLFLDLADRGVLGPLAGLLLAGDERPRRLAVVAAADQHAAVRRDDGGDDRLVRCPGCVASSSPCSAIGPASCGSRSCIAAAAGQAAGIPPRAASPSACRRRPGHRVIGDAGPQPVGGDLLLTEHHLCDVRPARSGAGRRLKASASPPSSPASSGRSLRSTSPTVCGYQL